MKNKTLLHRALFILLLSTWMMSKSIRAQPCLPSGITFYTQSQIDNFASDFPGCNQVIGDVIINEFSEGIITNLSGLSPLTSIGGCLSLYANKSLINLSGLNNLNYIGGCLSIEFNDSLISLSGLDNLYSIGGYLSVDGNALTSLNGLGNLDSIGGYFEVDFNAFLTNFDGLDNLKSIGGYVYVGYNSVLANLNGLDNLNSIGGYLFIITNASLTDLSGLNSLTSIEEVMEITDNASLTDLSGLNNLASISGGLSISSNASLSSLSGLSNLTSISGDLSMGYNVSLTSLSGLNNIDASTIGNLYLIENTSLSMCEVQNICDYLAISTNPATITGNTTGCNSRFEVEMACGEVSANEIFEMKQSIKIFPNPTKETFKITGVQEGEIKILDSLGRFIKNDVTQNNKIDISALPRGIYFILINLGDQLITQRIIKE